MCVDLASGGIEAELGACVEIVAWMSIPRPGCGVTDAPINGLGVLVIVAGHPSRSAARLPVIAFPRVMTGLTLARDGEGPPQFLAVVSIERDDIAPDAELAAGAADDDFSVDDQGHQGQILTLLVVLDLCIPDGLAGFGIKRHDMIVRGGEIELVLPQPDAAAGWMPLEQIVGKLALVPPLLFAGL